VSELVGREQPAAVLDAELDRTLASHGGLVLVAGEAGIGKSSLVAGAVDRARHGGAAVAVGTCWDREGAPGYWPWVQALRALERSAGPETWAGARAEAGGELGLLLGEGGGALGPAAGDAFGLHDAVTTLLVALARARPVVVVLEDLHWADPPTLRLLEFAARHGWYERLLLVGTYRDVEVEAGDHPLAPLIAPLVAKARAVTLTGLSPAQVGEVVTRTTGRTAPPEVVDELHRRTGGNPFFVEQTARLWQSTGVVDGVAPGVRDAVDRRLALLPEQVRDALATAALLGRATHRPVLGAVLGRAGPELDAVLGEALAARLLVLAEDGRLAFVHDLVREALVAGLAPDEARRRHAAVVAALDRPEAAEEVAALVEPGDLAHHAHRAGDRVDAERTVGLLLAAARAAASRMAVDEEAGHLRRALSVLPADRARPRAFVSVELGWALLRTGDLAASRRAFEEAAATALDLDDAALLTRAALSLRASVWLVASDEDRRRAAELVDRAHRRLVVDQGHPSAATSALGREQELTAVALEMCRRSGDERALWDALVARHDALWAPGTAGDRIDLADEMLAVAHRTGDLSSEVEASQRRVLDLVELGDPRALDEHEAFQARARHLSSGMSRGLARWTGALVAGLQGHFDEARALLDEAAAIDARAGHQHDDVLALAVQVRWSIELQQGRDDAIDTLLGAATEAGHPHAGLLRAVTALERGAVDRARAYADEVAGTGAEPARWFAPLWLRFRAQLAAATGDAERLVGARAALAPLRGCWAAMDQGPVDGPFSLWAGLVELGAGRWDEAAGAFEAAAAEAERLGARPWAVEARSRLAEARLARDPGDPGAAALLLAVEDEARALGMARVVARAQALGRAAGSPGPVPAPTAEPAPPGGPPATDDGGRPTFRRDGDVWALAYAGTTAHVPHAKGLADIDTLLARPGMGVRAVDLLHPEGGGAARAARSLGGDAVLDEQAKAAYRTRLGQLDDEIDRALARHDDTRAGALDAERAALITSCGGPRGWAGAAAAWATTPSAPARP